MKKTSFVLLIGWLLLTGLLGGCDRQSSAPSQTQQPRFAFIINVPGRFWDIAHAGCLQAAKEEGAKVEFYIPGESTAAQQKQILEDLISRGIDGVAITPLNPDSLARVLDQVGQSVPLICMDSDAPKSKRLCYVGTDNVAAGRAMGEAMKKALPNGGEVALFVGQLDVANARERQQGVIKALRGSNCKIVGTFTDGADRPTAKSNVSDVLAKYPNLKGILGLWGYNGPAAAKALEDSPGRDVKIVASDEEVETVSYIRQGKIAASVIQQPYEFGYHSIKILAKLHRKQPVELPANKIIHVPVFIMERSNLADIETTVNEKLVLLSKYLAEK